VFSCAPYASRDIKQALSDMSIDYHDVKLERTGMNPYKELKTLVNLVAVFKQIRPGIFLGYSIKPIIYGAPGWNTQDFSMMEGLGYTFMSTGLKVRLLGVIARNLYRLGLRFKNKVFFLSPIIFKWFCRID